MRRTLKVLDLLSGIGGRALGFQQAGYEVTCAVDNSILCKEVYSQIIENSQFILSDIDKIAADNLPDVDIITAKLIRKPFKRVSVKNPEKNANDAVFRIILKKMPRAFMLEIPSRMITSNKSAEFKSMMETTVFRRYSISYRIINEADFSGFPVSGKQAYLVGIRNDLREDEFYFPNGEAYERPIFKENLQDIDAWYRKITFQPDIELKDGMYYSREKGKFSEEKLIHMGIFREFYQVDNLGLRRLTHNECASLKGLSGYNFNKSRNKQDMYMKIAYASNTYVTYAIAVTLKKYLENVDYIEDDIERKKILNPNKKVNVPKNMPEDIVYPKHKITNIHVDNLKGIKNLDISLDKNLTAIMGVNGSGKSTILHALACAYKPHKAEEDYKFSFFFTPNPDSSWKDSKLSITYWDENLQKNITREYKKSTDRWTPRYADRPRRDTYYIGIETCMPEIEKERQTSYIDYKTTQANDKISRKIIESAAYVLNKNYDNLNYHKTKKKELFGVHTKDNMRYSSLSMGAGEQRVLRILRTVYTANTYSLILIDEIDILLHVTALKRLICILSKIAIQRNLQIIFTTHSMEMSKLQDWVDIRYLEPLSEKTMVYDTITPDIIYELSDSVEKKIKGCFG